MPYIFIGLLSVIIVILVVLFSKEKQSRLERDNALEESLVDSIKNLRQEQQDAEDSLRESLSDGISHLRNTIDETSRETRERIEDANRAIKESAKENKKLIDYSIDDLNRKIELLTTALEQINKENAELRKKLEFFTEIGEDSKKLNENEDLEERDRLINEALKELSEKRAAKKSEKTEKPDEKPEIKDHETVDEITDAPEILDEEQEVAFRIMDETNENLFITGKAGTGKSFLLEMFVRGTKKNVVVLAPTGIAALNVGGATLHSAFGYSNLEELELEEINRNNIRLKGEKQEVLKRVDTIIIDEISMVRADTFDKIDKILRVLNESAKPFGGKQMIVFGDLFQLPPIAKKQEERYLTDYYGGIFFFNSNSYGNGRFGFIELTTNHRQKEDKEFFNILNRMREGAFTSSDLDHLNARYVDDASKLRRVLTLFPKKAEAERMNREELAKIEAKEYVYKSRVIFNAYKNKTLNLDANFPISEELHLKRGALVMMVANDPNKRWVNGTLGIIQSLSEDSIKVTIDDVTFDIPLMTFTQREATYVKGHVEYRDVLSVEQFPVVLAYAITIHKSQGKTYPQVACDISQCFAPGQAYVALSRCTSINGLFLIEEIHGNMIHANKNVVDFYRTQSTEATIEAFL